MSEPSVIQAVDYDPARWEYATDARAYPLRRIEDVAKAECWYRGGLLNPQPGSTLVVRESPAASLTDLAVEKLSDPTFREAHRQAVAAVSGEETSTDMKALGGPNE